MSFGSLAFGVALVCAALMGFAITRGATCMVAAVDQIVRHGRASRLVAMGEASLWVAGGMTLAVAAGLMPQPLARHPILPASIAGAVLLGVGAYVNRACVFGSVARLGSREWHYLLTPVGFLAGCFLVMVIGPARGEGLPPAGSPSLPVAAALVLLAFMAWRVARLVCAGSIELLSARVWDPHHATLIIGITFAIMMLSVGAWTYPDALIALAMGMREPGPERLILFAALLLGAVWGGQRGGDSAHWSWRGAVRCAAGGALMGAGSVLIPGGNDGLILVGVPFLQPYAWLAIVVMLCSIAAAMAIEDAARRALVPRSASG